jgi:2-dehydro-3-deoxygalactonokinase
VTRPLVGVDWGTTSLRVARLGGRGEALEERALPRGILTVPAGEFPSVLQSACGDWLAGEDWLALVAGMAGSRQGWVEAPYCACPAGFAEIAAKLVWVVPGRVAIVPGLSCERSGVPDVMRGEETQVFGALQLLGRDEARVVLPGTHSKWVHVRQGRIESFATFMTGEVYALLRQHSILARTMPPEDGELDASAFLRGLDHAANSANLLHAAFSTRTLSLFERLTPEAAPSYLSGLMVGEELRSQDLATDGPPVVVVGSGALTLRYQLALKHRGIASQAAGSEATWRGLWALAQTLKANP